MMCWTTGLRSILLMHAHIRADVDLGETVLVESTPRDFGRIAAQTAKQVVLQRIKEVERDQVYGEFMDREGEIVTARVQRTLKAM